MINSGMSILACIDSLRHQAFSSYFRNVLDLIYEDVKGGSMLSDALNKHKKVFPDFFLQYDQGGRSQRKAGYGF